MARKWVAVGLWTAGVCVFIYLAQFAWLLRDGLAPGVVPSQGRLASQRFADGLLLASVPTLLLLGIGFTVFPWRKKVALQKEEAEVDGKESWPPPPRRP